MSEWEHKLVDEAAIIGINGFKRFSGPLAYSETRDNAWSVAIPYDDILHDAKGQYAVAVDNGEIISGGRIARRPVQRPGQREIHILVFQDAEEMKMIEQ